KDDLEAVRIIADALVNFEKHEQERIIRWARERVGLAQPPADVSSPSHVSGQSAVVASMGGSGSAPDIRTFINEKSPGTDVHFAAAVAYYYRFVAPQSQRKNEIDSETLQDACRTAQRTRLKKASKTLSNAQLNGYLDSGSQRGMYAINSVGENLVAMTLPMKDGKKKLRTVKK